jgi:large subunit ribosomal protein L1
MKSKRYRKVLNSIELKKKYNLQDAIEILKNNDLKRSENLELSFSLFWNSKQNNIRDFVIIPNPVKKNKIAIIDKNISSELRDRKDIVFISLDELPSIISRKKKSTWGFDKLFSHSSASKDLSSFAKVLSLKKSFPNVKDGTLAEDLEKAISEWEKGKIELRNDKGGNFHVLLGKASFEINQIEENYRIILQKIISLKPINWKGEYLKSITISTTMGPGIKLLI